MFVLAVNHTIISGCGMRKKSDAVKENRLKRKAAKISSTCMVWSPDDWFPSFEGGMVEMSITKYKKETCCRENGTQIFITGDDDFFLHKTYASHDEAKAFYNYVKEKGTVTKRFLLANGFDNL